MVCKWRRNLVKFGAGFVRQRSKDVEPEERAQNGRDLIP